jgi:hypothetical protein
MLVTDTAIEGAWYTTRVCVCGGGNCSSGYMHMHNLQATPVVATPRTYNYKADQSSEINGHNKPRDG